MPDPRFFQPHAGLTLSEIAAISGAVTERPTAVASVMEVAPLSSAGPQSVAFASDAARAGDLAVTRAGVVIIHPRLAASAPAGCAVLTSRFPHAAWAAVAAHLHSALAYDKSAGPIHPSAQIEEGAWLAPGVVVGPGAQIGRGTLLHPGVVIGPGVAIGRNCEIGANASVAFALVGDRVRILAGARIGEAGFSVAEGPGGAVDVPQLGRVILQDGVTVGANSCIDRGGWDDTVIGENTKLDNLVHVGHNVRIGRNCRLAAFTGISGSVTIGDGVLFGGKAGVADWVSIGDRAAIGASASVFKDVPAGETWTGFPARPLRKWLREQATLARLSKSRRGAKDDDERS